MTIPKLKPHSCFYSLRILLSLLAPRRDEIIPALYLDVSLSMKIGAQRKAGRGQQSKPSVCTLPMVPCGQPRPQGFSLKKWVGKALGTRLPCGSSSVTRVSRSPLPCQKLSA